MPRIEPGAAGWEASMLQEASNLAVSPRPGNWKYLRPFKILFQFERDLLQLREWMQELEAKLESASSETFMSLSPTEYSNTISHYEVILATPTMKSARANESV